MQPWEKNWCSKAYIGCGLGGKLTMEQVGAINCRAEGIEIIRIVSL